MMPSPWMVERRQDRTVSLSFYDFAEMMPTGPSLRVSGTCRLHELNLQNVGAADAIVYIADNQSPQIPWLQRTLHPGDILNYEKIDRGQQFLLGLNWWASQPTVSARGEYSQ